MRRSISRLLADRAAADPQAVLVHDDDGTLTAVDLDRSATVLATRLMQHGVRVDDLVAVSLPNSREFVIACAAVWRAGATPLPISPTLTPTQRHHVERTARPVAAIGAAPLDPSVMHVTVASSDGGPRVRPQVGRHRLRPDPCGRSSQACYREPLGGTDGGQHADEQLPDLAASSWKALPTSGSTGMPKIVRATAPALLDPTAPVTSFLPLTGTQLVTGPLTHSATFTYAFRGLFTGQSLVLHRRFDEQAWLDAVERHSVTWTTLVPTMMHRLLRLPAAQRPAERLRSLESVLHLGAPCARSVKREFLAWLGPARVLELYAGSESNGLTLIRGDDWLTHPGSVGRPIGGTEVEIRSPDGTVVPNGTDGVVWLRRGSRPAYGYLGAESRREVDGWDTLGDLGHLDDEGYLYLVDRADDVINRGSEKIYPAEVEQALEGHPAVRSAVAFALPHHDLGQQVGAVVDTADRHPNTADLLQWARHQLGAHAPAVLRVVHTPVRNDAGKTSRRAWADRWERLAG